MNTRQSIYTLVGVMTLVSGCLMVFFVYPTFKSIQHNSQEILSAKNSQVSIDADIVALNNFKKKYQDYESNLAKIDQMFVNVNDPVTFITFLESAALASGAKVDISLSAPKGSKDTALPVASFSLSVKGGFLNILQFSQKLESGPYLINILSATIRKAEIDALGKAPSHAAEANLFIEVVLQ